MEILEGILCALAGGLLGFVTSLLTLRLNYRKLFAETVSKNRMEWINVWRENISKFLAIAEEINYSKVIDQTTGIEYKTARNMVLSRLNTNEAEHVLMKHFIEQLNPLDNNFEKQRDYILELTRQILKPEWERVKSEAKGKGK